jgi:hypothetical protein
LPLQQKKQIEIMTTIVNKIADNEKNVTFAGSAAR